MNDKAMNKGILNGSLLEKNIEKIVFYTNEEKLSLSNICDKLIECSNNYNSTNTSLFLNDIENFKGNINKILEKRNRYTEVLNEAIVQYQTLSSEIQSKFDSEVDLI